MLANSSPREGRDGSLDVRRQPSTPPRRQSSTPGSRRRDVATELPGGVEERRDGSPPPWRSEEAPAYPSYFLAASRRCSMMGMPWGQVTSQDPHWMQSDALPGSACHW